MATTHARTHTDPHSRRFDPDHAADLRRVHARETTDHLLTLAQHLLPDDRALIEAVYLEGKTAVELVGSRPGLPDTAPAGDGPVGDGPAGDSTRVFDRAARAMRSRIRRLVRRMLRPEFGYTAHQIGTWTPTRQRVARACVLQGYPIRAAAARLDLSLHTVRRHLDAVQAMFELDRQRIAERLRTRPHNTEAAPRPHTGNRGAGSGAETLRGLAR